MPIETVKVQFTAKPGLYPPHKGGQTWLHERAHVARREHKGSPDGYQNVIVPRTILQSGDIVDMTPSQAETCMKRYPECFKFVDAKASKAKPKEA